MLSYLLVSINSYKMTQTRGFAAYLVLFLMHTNSVYVIKMYELWICMGLFHTTGITWDHKIVFDTIIPSTNPYKILEY